MSESTFIIKTVCVALVLVSFIINLGCTTIPSGFKGTIQVTPSPLSSLLITENFNMGWETLINNNYFTGSYTNNTFIAAGSTAKTLLNQTLTINTNNLTWKIGSSGYGQLFIGQLYPAGHTKFRINMSVIKSSDAPYYSAVTFWDGDLFRVDVYGFSKYQKAILTYYDVNGNPQSDKYITKMQNYIDFTTEYFPNGTTVLTDNQNSSNTLSSTLFMNQTFPYPLISSPTVRFVHGMGGGTDYMNMVLYNFEQSTPKNLITVYADNSLFPFGQDGPRLNYSAGSDWLKAHNQRETLWIDPAYYNALNTIQKADVLDLVRNKGFELGIHYPNSFNSLLLSTANTQMGTYNSQVVGIFGKQPLSWVSLGDYDNIIHAQMMWKNYLSLWRNMPNSNAGNLYGTSTMQDPYSGGTDSGEPFWSVASQYKSFVPTYTHSVIDPLNEDYSMSYTNFSSIMGNYVNSGVKIVPYAEWYYENANTVAPITNIYFSPTNSYFSINTHGYNATTKVYDPHTQGIWYSIGGKVLTTIDNANVLNTKVYDPHTQGIWYSVRGKVLANIPNTNATNMIINTPTNLVIQKANATFTVSSDNIVVNVSTWNTTGDYHKKWSESSITSNVTTQHVIGDFPANKSIQIKKNGVFWDVYTTNSTGYISFNYNGGYFGSGIVFECDPVAHQ